MGRGDDLKPENWGVGFLSRNFQAKTMEYLQIRIDNGGYQMLKGLAHAKIIKKSVILFRVLNMTIWCKHVHRLELHIFIIFVLLIHQLG